MVMYEGLKATTFFLGLGLGFGGGGGGGGVASSEPEAEDSSKLGGGGRAEAEDIVEGENDKEPERKTRGGMREMVVVEERKGMRRQVVPD